MTITAPEELISIVIPAYNAASTLRETLASASRQTHEAIEIIVVDDGSTDGVFAVAQGIAATEPRLRIVRQENRGVAAARNRGIALARGAWVATLDADDLWRPDKLSRQLDSARRSNAATGFVYCWSRDIDADGRVWRDGPRPTADGRVALRLLADNFCNSSALLLRRDAALAVGGYNEQLRRCEDVQFQLRLARSFPAAVAPAYLVGYRKREGSLSSDPEAMFSAWLAARALLGPPGGAAAAVDRRNLARRRAHLAEALARRGRIAAALRHAAASIAVDPLRGALVGADLAWRLARRRRPQERPLFDDLDACQAAFPAPSGLPLRLLNALEDARRRQLAHLDDIEPG